MQGTASIVWVVVVVVEGREGTWSRMHRMPMHLWDKGVPKVRCGDGLRRHW